jgi:hypothetical protein
VGVSVPVGLGETVGEEERSSFVAGVRLGLLFKDDLKGPRQETVKNPTVKMTTNNQFWWLKNRFILFTGQFYPRVLSD